jgi:hypothetical protein
MLVRAFIMCCILLSARPLVAGVKSDVVVMENGDRLTCRIKGLDAGVLSVSLDYVLGTISVQWSKVYHVESTRLFLVKTENGSVYSGTISTPAPPEGKPLQIQVAEAPESRVLIDGSQVVQMSETSEKFLQRFNGDINLGLIYSKANQSTQYTLGSLVDYPRKDWAARASFDSTLSSSSGSNAATRNQIGLGLLHLLPWNKYFYFGRGYFLQSSGQGIDLQTNAGTGIGRNLKNTNKAKISLLGGLAWQNTNYGQSISPIARQNLAAAMVASDLRLFFFNKTTLTASVSLFPSLSEPGRLYTITNASYYIKLFSNLSWNISFYGNWDNRPPSHLAGSDYGTSSGLTWKFGNR